MTHPLQPRYLLALLALTLLGAAPGAAAEAFPGAALRGIERVHVDVTGVHPDFERYGLTAAELREKAAAQLAAAGLRVVGPSDDAGEGDARVLIRLNANRDQYAFYFYGVSVQIHRPLALGGGAHTAQAVWSDGRHGVINPSDWRRVYGYVETLVADFLDEHGRQNAGRTLGYVP